MDSLSIIIVNYNTYRITCDCLRSIYLSNVTNIDLEVILVDNGSSEIQPVPFQALFTDIIYIRSESNVGFAKGNNIGLKMASKSYVLLLNSDTLIVDPDTFSKTIEMLKCFDNRIVLTTKLLTPAYNPQVAYGPIPTLIGELILSTFIYKILPGRKITKLLLTFSPDESRIIDDGYITATYFLFAREILNLLPDGRLYEETFMYGEELFWATSWLQHGVRMYYYADASIVHLIGQSSKQDKNYDSKIRRTHQLKSERDFLLWRYTAVEVILIYLLRLARFAVIAPFNRDIRTRLVLLWGILLSGAPSAMDDDKRNCR